MEGGYKIRERNLTVEMPAEIDHHSAQHITSNIDYLIDCLLYTSSNYLLATYVRICYTVLKEYSQGYRGRDNESTAGGADDESYILFPAR